MSSVFTEQLFHSIFLPNHDFSKKRSTVNIKSVEHETDVVTADVIDVFVYKNTAHPPPNKVCEAVRWIVDELLERSNKTVMPLVNQLTITSQVDNEYAIVFRVLDTIFDDGQINWGRVGVTYVFGLRLAELYRQQNIGNRDDEIMKIVSLYIKQKLASWILSQGGWESIRHHFSDEKELLSKLKSAGVVLFTLGMGALTAVLT